MFQCIYLTQVITHQFWNCSYFQQASFIPVSFDRPPRTAQCDFKAWNATLSLICCIIAFYICLNPPQRLLFSGVRSKPDAAQTVCEHDTAWYRIETCILWGFHCAAGKNTSWENDQNSRLYHVVLMSRQAVKSLCCFVQTLFPRASHAKSVSSKLKFITLGGIRKNN